MTDVLIAIATIFALLTAWIFAQHAAHLYAAKHPEFGPAKEEGSGCTKICHCRTGKCNRED